MERKSIINGKYLIEHKIGQGSFGEIFQGVNISTNSEVAIKIEANEGAYSQLMYEYKVYKAIEGGCIYIIQMEYHPSITLELKATITSWLYSS